MRRVRWRCPAVSDRWAPYYATGPCKRRVLAALLGGYPTEAGAARARSPRYISGDLHPARLQVQEQDAKK
ncbi:hypothetical protein CBM2599_A50104 [Cupriavidus taiwanensis]|nr:hypothetical protein CBM2599_A50104 [Cupriavidus taiwanensis]SOY91281.1 hypothetical protein CBM2600_A60103 [Cupriavidus taiwanensis]